MLFGRNSTPTLAFSIPEFLGARVLQPQQPVNKKPHHQVGADVLRSCEEEAPCHASLCGISSNISSADTKQPRVTAYFVC